MPKMFRIIPLEIFFLFLNNRRSLTLTLLLMRIPLERQLRPLTIKPSTGKIHHILILDPHDLNNHLKRIQNIPNL